MSRSALHTFHTRHDFTPELGWAAFQLIHELGRVGLENRQLEKAAQATTSPLSRRSDLSKIIASLEDLGIVERDREALVLTTIGRAIAEGIGKSEVGFRASVHCLYAWQWLWSGEEERANPSWSYREVCHQILACGPSGITADDIVLRVVEAASRFDAERVSFSRSSVVGATGWLRAQTPPLVEVYGRTIVRIPGQPPAASPLRLNLTALCALSGGEAVLEATSLGLLAESLLVPAEELWLPLVEYARDSPEFCFVPGGRGKVVFRGSGDPFIQWIIGAGPGGGSG